MKIHALTKSCGGSQKAAASALPAPASHEMDDQANDSHNEQKVNQCPRHVECEKAQKPSHQEHDKQSEKHAVNHLSAPEGAFAFTVSAICQTFRKAVARQVSRRKLPFFSRQFSHYATSLFLSVAGACTSSSNGVRTLQTWILSVLLSIVCTNLLIAVVKMSHRGRSHAFAPFANPRCAKAL